MILLCTCDSESTRGCSWKLARVIRNNPQIIVANLLAVQHCGGNQDTCGGVEPEVQPRHPHLEGHGYCTIVTFIRVLYLHLKEESSRGRQSTGQFYYKNFSRSWHEIKDDPKSGTRPLGFLCQVDFECKKCSKVLVSKMFFTVFERSLLCSPRLHLFGQKMAKTVILWFFLNYCFLFEYIFKCHLFILMYKKYYNYKR